MKKFLLILWLLLFFSFCAASQPFSVQKAESAVRPVTISIRFSKDIISLSHIHLFYMLERESGQSIIDQYLPLTYGSGFFISEEGHLLTNHHVIDINAVGQNIGRYMNGYLNAVDKEYGYLFSRADYAEFSEVVQRIFTEGEIDRLVLLDDGREYKLELVNSDDTRDLALLKLAEPKRTQAIQFVRKDDMGNVKQVFSIGYPLPETLDLFFKGIHPTISSGIVSARREKVLPNNAAIKTLQHTASINPGNSGGALVTETGLVAGVNSSLLTDANNIYFAISMEAVEGWLADNGKADLMQTRAYSAGGLIQEGVSRIEVGFTSSPEGARVHIEDQLIGITPCTIKLSAPREYEVSVELEGYVARKQSVFVPDEENFIFDFALHKGGAVHFQREIPPTLQVVTKRGEELLTFNYFEPVILQNGEWAISFDGPISNGVTENIRIDSGTVDLSLDSFLLPMQVRLPNLLQESEVALLPSRVPIELMKDSVELPYGTAEFLVTTPTYRDFIFTLVPDNQETSFTIDVEYRRNNDYYFRRNLRWGLPVLLGGAALAGASSALNLAPGLLASVSGSYSMYAALKYTTFGTMVAGWAAMGVGLAGTIKALTFRNRTDIPIQREYNFADEK